MHDSVGHSNIYTILMKNLKANYSILTASKGDFLKPEWYLDVQDVPVMSYSVFDLGWNQRN